MGKKFVKFACHHCSHCCTDVVCLPTPWDVIRIVKHTKQHPLEFLDFLTPEEIEDVDHDDPTWLRANGEKYVMALKRGRRGCFFLNKKTKHCTIYEARPILCRLYPFELQESKKGKFKGFSLHKDVGCPRHRDGKVRTGPLYDLYEDDCDHHDDYNKLVKRFNKRKDDRKQPEDFIDLFIKVKRVTRR
jgi:Fe-S-cluster containining protein